MRWFVVVLGGLWWALAGCGQPDDDSPTPPISPIGEDEAPTVKITSPANNAVVVLGAPVNLAGQVTDDLDAAQALSVKWESTLNGVLYEGNPDTSGRTTTSVSNLQLGTHTLTLTATDSGGQSSQATLTLTVKSATNNAPTASITSPATGAVLPSGGQVSLVGKVSDVEDAEEALTTTFSSSLQGTLGSATPSSAGDVTLSITLRDGAHDLTLKVTDTQGKSTTSAVVKVAVGNDAPPVVTLIDPDIARYNEGETVLLDAVVSDDVTAPAALVATWSSNLDGVLSECSEPINSDGTVSCALDSLSVGEQVITLSVQDSRAQAGSDTLSFEINGPPSIPVVRVQPSTPNTSDTLQAIVETDATDPNGDEVNYVYQWYRDGILMSSLTGPQVSETVTLRDELWKVEVRATDGELEGEAASASVKILNTPPTLSSVDISPLSGNNSTTFFCLPQSYYLDVDGDVGQYLYEWLQNGAVVSGATGVSFTPTALHPNDKLQCRATPYDGTDKGSPALSAAVLLGNRLPSVVSATISPSSGNVSSTFTCVGGGWSDPDKDSEGYHYEWLVNGEVFASSASLSGSSLRKGDVLLCRLIPFDGISEGASVLSSAVVLDNAAPTVSSLAIEPTPAYADSSLRCKPQDYVDPDGDAESVEVTWSINGSTVSGVTGSLDSGFVRGDKIRCSAKVSDGQSTPVQLSASEITIVNSKPSITSVSLSPGGGSAATTFTAKPQGYEDADGDTAQYRYQWYINGVASVTTATISPGPYKNGDTLRVEVRPYDGLEEGETRSSALITVGSTSNPPSIDSVSLSPTTAYETSTLTCTPVGAVDPEGDTISFTYGWSRNSLAIAGATTNTLTGTLFSRGEVIQCTITPRDASMTGAPVSSNKVTIQNSLPSLSKASVTPVPATKATSLTCSVEGKVDADGDTVNVAYAWTVNGVANVATGATLSPNTFKRGDTVSCTATPNDGISDGVAVTSTTVTVQGSVPVIGQVSLTPAKPYVTDTLTCTPSSVVDADGDAITFTYRWLKGSTVISGATSATLAGSTLKKGDVITCEVTPKTSSETGTSVASSPVTVQNSAPVLTSLSLTPESATETTVLTCAALGLSDADGDTLTQVWSWSVNGNDAGVITSTLNGSHFKRGDQVRCALTATDTSGGSVSATSNTVTIKNSPPSLTSVVLGPEPAYVTSTLTCTPQGVSDADGDSVGYLYAWKINGTTNTSVTTSFYNASSLTQGSKVQCVVTPVDDLSAGTAVSSNTVTIVNQAPSITTVTLTPQLAYETTVLTCAASGISDPDGDPVTLKYAWTVAGSKVTPTSSTLDGTYFSKGQEVFCEITPSDTSSSGSSKKSNTVTIENSVPVLTGASLTPSSGDETTTFTCSGSGQRDADSDTVTLRYAWTVDGSEVVGATTNTLTGASFARDNVIVCLVTPYDGSSLGATVASNSATVVNTPPTFSSSPAISPTSPKVNDGLTCAATGADLDGDSLSYTYAWKVNGGTLSGQTGATLSTGYVKNDKVSCVVRVQDGKGGSVQTESSSVTIQNSAPSVATGPTILPSLPKVTDALSCSATGTDIDTADSVSLAYVWRVNGSALSGQSNSTLGSGFKKGDIVTCTVTPNDGSVDGTAKTSAAVTIQNSAPSVTVPTISPTSPKAGDQLTCSATGSDVDTADTVSLSYVWTVNGTTASGQTTSTYTKALKKNDSVTCTVTPNDGTANGTSRTSAAVSVGNTAPSITAIEITPSSPKVSDSLTCSVTTSDPDSGDVVSLTYVWRINGTVQSGQVASTLSSGYKKSDSVSCTATPNDGTTSGTSATSASVTVGNAAPTVTVPTISPSSPKVSDTLSCSATGSDIDGDPVTLSYGWKVNSNTVSGTSSTLSTGYKKGDSVTCTVTPNDGTVAGTAQTSAAVTIQNSAPTVSTPVITPSSPKVADPLVCTASGSDLDGDTVTLSYVWRINGNVVSGQTSSSLTTGYKKGDSVTCTVTPTDGTVAGTALTSAAVSIGNTAPVSPKPVITPSNPTVNSTLTCVAPASDADAGDTISMAYVWHVNSVLQSGQTSSTLATGFKKGDSVTCSATPSDGTDTGAQQTSPAVSIGNTAPSVSTPVITPSNPVASSTLSCTATGSDVDVADTVIFTYGWAVNGTVQSGQTSSTLSTGFKKGDEVTCTVTPTDGTSSGSAKTSAAVTIGNSAPVAALPVVTPTSPTVNDTLVCAGGATDIDTGDTINLAYTWLIDGTVQGGQTGSTLASGTPRGKSVACTITPSDGTDTGTTKTSNAVTIVNSKPTLTGVTLTPITPNVSSTLTCTPNGAQDADNDTLSYVYAWLIDDTVLEGATSSTLSGLFNRGNMVSCRVTPNDGIANGASYTSEQVEILNAVPTAPTVTISPAEPEQGQELSASAVSTDADGDPITYTWAWKRDGTLTSFTYFAIPIMVTLEGELWTAIATPSDGFGDGPSGQDEVLVGPASADSDEDGFTSGGGDCDDTDPTIFPYAAEPVDGKDSDCNGTVDDRWSVMLNYGVTGDPLGIATGSSALVVEADGFTRTFFSTLTAGGSAHATYAETDLNSENYILGTPSSLSANPGYYHRLSLYQATDGPFGRLLFYDHASSLYRFRFENSAGWQSEITFSTTSAIGSGGAALVTSSAGTDYAYYVTHSSCSRVGYTNPTNYRLVVRSRTAASTTFTTTTDVSSSCYDNAVVGIVNPRAVVDSTGSYAHLTWYVTDGSKLRYRKTGLGVSSSSAVDVVSGANVSSYQSVAVHPTTSGAQPVVIYFDPTNVELKKASTTDGTTWTTATWLGSTQLGGVAVSPQTLVARMDTQGKLHVIFVANAQKELWYATDASGVVVAEKIHSGTVALNTRDVNQFGLAVDADLNPRVSFPDPASGTLRVWRGKVYTTNLVY